MRRLYRPIIWGVLLFQSLCILLSFSATADSSVNGLNVVRTMELQLFGRTFDNEPAENRMARLEYGFHQPTLKGMTLSYRLERLTSAYQAQYLASRQLQAIQAYNNGIDAANLHQVERAIDCYKKALFLNPQLVVAYNNLGNLLERVNRYPDAIKVYEQALLQINRSASEKKNDELALIHRNLGVLYEKDLKIDEALSHYREYLKLATHPDSKVAMIVHQYHFHKEIEGKSTDYVVSAQEEANGRSMLWDRKINPIPLYVAFDPDQVAFLPAITESLRAWEKASNRRIIFKEVGTAAQALIRIRLQEGPLSHPYLDVGRTQYDAAETEKVEGRPTYQKIQITINTGERDLPISLEDRLVQVRRLVLHEVGHAIGIWGHSPDPGDIMYSRPIVKELSARDVRTIERLYEEFD